MAAIVGTALIYALRGIAPVDTLLVVYLPGIVLVAIRWGLLWSLCGIWLAASAFQFTQVEPIGELGPKGQYWVGLIVFAIIAQLTSAIAGRAYVRFVMFDRRDLEADALRQSEAATTAVLHAVSHDLRTPLTVLSSATESLQGDRITSDQRRELHEVIREASARLTLLVNGLLDLARLQSGTSSPKREWIDVEEVILAAVAGQPGLRVEVGIGQLPLIRADPVQLERVLSNLLENARKHGRGERVKVTATASDSEVRIEISDAGPGLDQALGEQMFEPFRSGGETEGSGLGLAIVRGFVEANDGTVWADYGNEAGARFVVALPLTGPPGREPTPGGGER